MNKQFYQRILRDGDQRFHRALSLTVCKNNRGVECCMVQIVPINKDTVTPECWVSHHHFPGQIWNVYIVSPIPSRPVLRAEALAVAKLYVDGKLRVWIADQFELNRAIEYMKPRAE